MMIRRLVVLAVAGLAVSFWGSASAAAADAAAGKAVYESAKPSCKPCHTDTKNPLAKTGAENSLDELKGPNGTLARVIPGAISVRQDGDTLLVERPDDERDNRSLHGLTRSLVNNMVVGVTAGYAKELEIVGVGYRAEAQGPQKLRLALGYSHPVLVDAPDGITFEVPAATLDRLQNRGRSSRHIRTQVCSGWNTAPCSSCCA